MPNRLFQLMLFIGLALFTSCIGTDFVDEPLAPAPARAEILQSDLSLIVGETSQLDFRLLGGDGREQSTTWSWSSRDLAIAEVNDQGIITAIAPGQTWIDGLTAAGPADSVLVTVVADPTAVAGVSIVGANGNLQPGESLTLTAEVRNANGDLLTNQSISWKSSNPAVASVSDQGLVSAQTDGQANITASAAGINSLPFAINVQTPSTMRMGTFMGKNGYTAQGKVVLQNDGSNATLEFDNNFSTQNGPGLYVYLSPNENNVSGGISLGKLQSTSGAQTYTIPGTADPSAFSFVIIYCQPFGVPFGAATLQ